MNNPFYFLDVFCLNPDKSFTISDLMRKNKVCWATAKDYIIYLKEAEWIYYNGRGDFNSILWSLNKNKLKSLCGVIINK